MPVEGKPPFLPLRDFRLHEDPPDAVEVTGVAGGGGSTAERPRAPEPLSTDTSEGLVIPVPRDPVGSFTPGITVIEGTGFGPLGDGLGDFGGPVVVKGDVLDHPPRTRLQVAPDYPVRAKEAGLEGEVVVEFVVNEAGRVMSPLIASSSDSIFEEAALRAVLRWRFVPGTVKGTPVRFRMAVPLVFRLER